MRPPSQTLLERKNIMSNNFGFRAERETASAFINITVGGKKLGKGIALMQSNEFHAQLLQLIGHIPTEGVEIKVVATVRANAVAVPTGLTRESLVVKAESAPAPQVAAPVSQAEVVYEQQADYQQSLLDADDMPF